MARSCLWNGYSVGFSDSWKLTVRISKWSCQTGAHRHPLHVQSTPPWSLQMVKQPLTSKGSVSIVGYIYIFPRLCRLSMLCCCQKEWYLHTIWKGRNASLSLDFAIQWTAGQTLHWYPQQRFDFLLDTALQRTDKALRCMHTITRQSALEKTLSKLFSSCICQYHSGN